MNRKQFFQSCAGSLCGCAAAGSACAQSAPAQAKPAEDWRLPFIQKRYAKLIEIMGSDLGEAQQGTILRKLGWFCASGSPLVRKHRGNLDGFIREFKQAANEDITYDQEKGLITVTGPVRNECFCPLVDGKLTPASVCECSLGWQKCTYETLLDRRVEVTLKESVLRGGKRCVFEVKLQPKQA